VAPLVAPPAQKPAPTTRRRSRAKPKPPRERIVVRSELKGLGGFVVEFALLDPTAAPQASVVEWANHLAAELDVPGVGNPATYRELLHAILKVARCADADPDRPMVAIPRAQAA
jgi:hypothetical protein